MIKKITTTVSLVFILFFLSFCSEDSLIEEQTSADEASRRRSKPIALAGEDASIALPVNSITLDGSLSTSSYSAITSY